MIQETGENVNISGSRLYVSVIKLFSAKIISTIGIGSGITEYQLPSLFGFFSQKVKYTTVMTAAVIV
jgi:hypothetical protein